MPSLTDRRRQATRLDIAETALALFARNGFENVTAEAIATESGVSLRTFYRYFAVKADVLRPLFESRAQRIADAVAARPASESPARAVQRAISALNAPRDDAGEASPFLQVLTDSPALFERWLRDVAIFETPLLPVVRSRLGPEHSADEARYTTSTLVLALRLAFEQSYTSRRMDQFPDVLATVLAYLRGGARLEG